MNIILISGRKRCGKDTIAEFLCKKLGDNAIVLPNAKAVKEEAYETFNWDGEKDTRGRQLLVDITNTGYNYDPVFWEKKTVEQIYAYLNMGRELDTVIIPDWRYETTYDFFTNLQGLDLDIITIRVEKNLSVEEMCDPTISKEVALSESQLDDFPTDFTIKNNGTLEDLESLVDKLIESKVFDNAITD